MHQVIFTAKSRYNPKLHRTTLYRTGCCVVKRKKNIEDILELL